MSYDMILNSGRRKNSLTKKRIFMFILLALIIFLSIWQKQTTQKEITVKIITPQPTEIK